MIDFPTINLHLFSKLEFFELLRRWNEKERQELDNIKEKIAFYDKGEYLKLNYPTWELEKKFLFWWFWSKTDQGSYIFEEDFRTYLEYIKEYEIKHTTGEKYFEADINYNEVKKYIDDKKNKNRVKDFNRNQSKLLESFISQNEICNAGFENVLDNLVEKGFVEKKFFNWITFKKEGYTKKRFGYKITNKGLAFAELIWNLYFPQKDKGYYDDIFKRSPASYDCSLNRPTAKSIFKLKRRFREYILLFSYKLQLYAIKLFYILGAIYLTSLVLDWAGLSNDLKEFFLNFDKFDLKVVKIVFFFLIISPFLLFMSGLILECFRKVFMWKKSQQIKKKISNDYEVL